jgi:hypothetical protein
MRRAAEKQRLGLGPWIQRVPRLAAHREPDRTRHPFRFASWKPI